MPILSNGQRLGVYVVGEMIGQGGMAEVYRATHGTLDREVAIKVLNPTFNSDPTFPLRFLREAKASARLNHPNIITVYDFDEKGEIAYLVMELATGGTFAERTRRFVTLSEAVEALAPVFDAVQYAHRQGIVHRDIKPDNVLLTEQLRPLLADFGLARIQSESLDVDEVGLILGTPYYMAPEQVLAEDVDGRADVYALGILTYAIVAGRVPFDGGTFTAIAQQHLKSPPPSVRAVVPDAPERLDAAIRKATAKRREDRFDTVADFYAELKQAAAEAPDLHVGARAMTATPGPAAVPAPTTGSEMDRTVVSEGGGRTWAPVIGDEGAQCPTCSSMVRPGIRFCTVCGGRMPEMVTQQAAPQPVGAAVEGPADALPIARRRRRASAFSTDQWIGLALAALAVLVINAIGLWLAQAGRSAGEGGFAGGITTYIYDHLPWFKSGMTLVALTLAGLASYDMWLVVMDRRERTPDTYRRLRQYHRLMGYAAAITAFSIGLLTCVGIFGFDFSTTRRAIHTVVGTTLLIVIVSKVGVVRWAPRYRRYLNLLGFIVLGFYALTFATSAVPWVWGQITGDQPVYYYGGRR
jgi:tRNA A-37 threonylcarbamoyl transferase component Bud32